VLRRLVEEFRGRHDDATVARARAALRIDGTTIDRARGVPLAEAVPVDRVTIAAAVYATTPTRAARISLLAEAARIAPTVRVHVPVVNDGTRLARLLVDPPRRVLPLSAEPGDRFAGHFAHATFDDEELVTEATRAGLVLVRREGSWVVLERGRAHESPASFARELRRAIATMREAERQRQRSPAEAVATMRRRGETAPVRGPIGRARLRRAIGWVDAAYVRARPNCFRRVLTEIALDGGAAREAIVFGLDVGRTGHVAFEGSEDLSFDVAFAIPPG